MLLQACINGARRPTEHPALPMTAAELAADAVRVTAAGAAMVHLHPKNVLGEDTLDFGVLAETLAAVRAAAPGIPLGVTTGAWTVANPRERLVAIRRWRALPDFASVNWHEAGAEDVAGALMERGVGVEAGLWHVDAVGAWLAFPHRHQCCRVLLELPDGLDDHATVREADVLLAALGASRDQMSVLLHGEGTSCWPALTHAARLGLQTRVGLEDVLYLPDGTPAADNAALVSAVCKILREENARLVR